MELPDCGPWGKIWIPVVCPLAEGRAGRWPGARPGLDDHLADGAVDGRHHAVERGGQHGLGQLGLVGGDGRLVLLDRGLGAGDALGAGRRAARRPGRPGPVVTAAAAWFTASWAEPTADCWVAGGLGQCVLGGGQVALVDLDLALVGGARSRRVWPRCTPGRRPE